MTTRNYSKPARVNKLYEDGKKQEKQIPKQLGDNIIKNERNLFNLEK